MITIDSELFQELPPLTSAAFSTLAPGQELPLLLIEYTQSGVGVLFPLQYVHGGLTRNDQGELTAFGKAQLIGLGAPKGVTVHFPRPHDTAVLVGLPMKGPINLGSRNIRLWMSSFQRLINEDARAKAKTRILGSNEAARPTAPKSSRGDFSQAQAWLRVQAGV